MTKLEKEEYSTFSKINKECIESFPEQEYNPYEHRDRVHHNTYAGALIHLLKSSLGTGILAIPSAISAAGIVLGVIGTVLTGILCTHTIHLLIFASQEVCKKAKVPKMGFSETAHSVFTYGPGKVQHFANCARVFVDMALLLTHCTGCGVFVVFISGCIRDIVEYHNPSTKGWALQLYMLMLLFPLILCCQIRQLKNLVPFSLIANTTMIIAFGITLYYIFSGISTIPLEDRKVFNDITNMPLFFSTVLFAMEGIGTMLPIENTLIKPQFIGCFGILNVAMTAITILYTTIGLCGYLRFGDDVNANVVAELPDSDIAAQVAKLCIAASVFFTFMLQFYVPCEITWRMLSPRISHEYHNVAKIALRIVLVVFITAIAAAVPKLDSIIGLMGSVCLSTLGLFIPAVIDIILNLGENQNFGIFKWRLWKNILIIILAWFALFSGSYYGIESLIE